MKGTPPTEAEKKLHDRIAALGCIACKKEGIFNPHVSIHHAYGRTRPGAQKHVLPLCGPHHQPDGTALAFHGNKAQWQKKYGKQDDLIQEIYLTLGLPYEPMGSQKRDVSRTLAKDKPRKTFEERQAEENAAKRIRDQQASLDNKASTPRAKAPFRKLPGGHNDQPVRKIQSGQKGETQRPKIPKSKIPVPKSPRSKLQKPVKTARQIEYEKKAKAEQKRLRAEQARRVKEANKEKKDAGNTDILDEYKKRQLVLKEQAKESRKQFMAEMKLRRKQSL